MTKKVRLKKGFYRHFKSKDDLLVDAVARALNESGQCMVEVAKSAPEGQALRAVIERYLSTGHANSPGSGCVRAAPRPAPVFARSNSPSSTVSKVRLAHETRDVQQGRPNRA